MEKTELSDLLREMEAFAAAEHVPIINAQGRRAFVQVVTEVQPQRILEIGTAIGYSALLMLSHTQAGAAVTTLELSAERYREARAYLARSSYAAQVTQLRGNAGELLTQLKGPYDFVFIDAAKGQYPDYLHKVLPLLTPEATIVADNVLFRGYVRSQEKPPRRYKTIVQRLRRYIAEVEALPNATTEILERGDGLAVTRLGRGTALD